MRKTLSLGSLATTGALSLALLVGLMTRDGFSAPAAPAAPAASPFGALTPAAPVAPVAGPAAPTVAQAAAAAAASIPRIIVIDRSVIMQRSSAGKEMVAQTQNLSKVADTQFRTEETQLQNEATQLQQQLAILAADVRDQKTKDFATKQQAFQVRVQTRQTEIQNGFNKAARQVEIALEPILQAIMRERNANMVLDRSAVIIAAADVDVTTIAVQRLDKSLPHVKVDLVKSDAPPGAVAAAPAPAAAAPAAAGRR